MNILHFKPSMRLEEGGVVKAVLDLCTMSQSVDTVTLATFGQADTPTEWSDHTLPNTTKLKVLNGTPGRAAKLSKDHLDQIAPLIEANDIVHLHSIWSRSNAQVANLCIKLNTPYIISIHGMLDDWSMAQRKPKKVFYLNTLGRKLLPNAAAVHCTAQAELDQASKWFPKSKGKVVPLPFDLEDYKDMPSPDLAYSAFDKLNPDLPKILFLSRIHYKKGVDRLIKSSALLKAQGVDHQLVIAGTGDEPYVQEMKQLATSESIEDSTYFLGFASGKEKVALLNACEIFSLPTSQENFGFVYFEALASATTVVTTKGTDTWPELQSSKAGIIVDNTPQAFADAYKDILDNLDSHKANAQHAREWTFSEMSPQQVTAKFNEMYASSVR